MSLPFTGSATSRRLQFLLLLLASFPLVAGQVSDLCPHQVYGVSDYENPLYENWLSAYDVKSYELSLAVSNEHTVIEGSASILVEATRHLDTLVFELQDGLEVSAVILDSHQLEYEHKDNAIFIFPDRSYEAGDLIRVVIFYGGDAGRDRGFFAGVSSRSDFKYGFDVTYTLSEPMNASDWFPAKQVLHDKIDSVTFRITCGPGLMAGSNGILVDVQEVNDSLTFTWKTRYPMAYYLLSFAVADYRDYSFQAPLSGEGDSVLVQNFIYNSDEVFAELKEDVEMTAPMMSSFSKLLVDYPFSLEKYGHCMAPMGGGMEHQTMTTIQDFDFFLVAHELAHQWFGDHITCGNWQDIWINEGFASYMEYIAAQELLNQDVADEWMNNAMSIALRKTRGSVYVPENEVEDTYRLFDYGLSYKKGAILLHMIRFILDDDPLFFQVLRVYLEQYGSGLARGSDFQAILEAESRQDFSAFFRQWYYGEGFPRFKLYWQQRGDSLHIRSEQSTSAPEITPLFQVPFELEVITAGGDKYRFTLLQNSNVEAYSIPVEGRVEDLRFDPDNYLLETSSVLQEIPIDQAYRYGPNPFSSDLFLQFPNAGPFETVRITNMAAQEILILKDLENPATMDLSSLADGSYLLEFSNDRGTFLEQIVKVSSD